MRAHLAPSGALLIGLVLLGVACDGGSGAPYVEPKEPRVTCPAPTLVNGGLNPAVDPGPVCVGAPQESALPAVPAAGSYGWEDLGEHTVGEVVDVQVPPGTASLLFVEQLVSGGPPNQRTITTVANRTFEQVQDNVAVIGELRDPSGQVVYSDLRLITGHSPADLLTAAGAGPVTGSVAYPSTSAGLRAVGTTGVAPGTWKVLVNDYGYECYLAAQPVPLPELVDLTCSVESRTSDAVYRLFVLTTPAATGGTSAIRARGTLDVAFHLVDAPTPVLGLTAAQAPDDPAVRRMIDSLGWLLSGAGVCLGTVTFHDEPDWARERFATHTSAGDTLFGPAAGECGNLPALLATSRPGQLTIDLFLVPFLLSSPGDLGSVIGVDGTIPGPASVNGTIASGAVVSAEDLRSGSCPAPGTPNSPPRPITCGQDLVAYIAAHEAGHYLGLYHPTEGTATRFDPLFDTPHCNCLAACGFTAALCQTGIPGSLCTRPTPLCAGGGNLMFWQLGPASVGYLSPEQALIVRSSPVVHSP